MLAGDVVGINSSKVYCKYSLLWHVLRSCQGINSSKVYCKLRKYRLYLETENSINSSKVYCKSLTCKCGCLPSGY